MITNNILGRFSRNGRYNSSNCLRLENDNVMEDLQGKIEDLAGRLASIKKTDAQEGTKDSFKNNYFIVIDEAIKPLVNELNQILLPSGSRLDFVSPKANESYLSSQIVFHDIDSKWNLLSDPYLLIEGDIKDNKMVVSEGLSKEWGKKISINSIDSASIDEYKRIISNNLVELMEKQIA